MNSRATNILIFLSDSEVKILEEVDARIIRCDSNHETVTFDCGYFSKIVLHCDGVINCIGPMLPKQTVVFAKVVERMLNHRIK